MKKWIGNILIKLILNANETLRRKLFIHLENDNFQFKIDSYKKKYQIKNSFRFNGQNILFYGNGNIFCGENSYIGNNSTIQAYDNYMVRIGNNCSISHNVRIYTSSNETNQNMNSTKEKKKKNGDVIIGDGVWIGANVFINPGYYNW